jgi:glyoxylase-like metal-dependent hydrolase (beta-lactamase superfamily II)
MKIETILAPNPGPFTLDGTRTYVLDGTAVIDPGPDIASHVEAILAAAPNLRTILITHRHADHSPAAVPLKQRCHARIFAPANTLADEVVDRRIHGGEHLDLSGIPLEVIATPGHTNEHVCFLSADGDLFTGDTILGSGTTAIFPPDGDMGDYLLSLQLLRSKSPRRIFPAHGPTRDDAVALIDEYIAHRLDREAQIVAALRGRAATIPELRRTIYPELDPRLEWAAEVQLLAHLIKLVGEGRVGREGEEYKTVS